MERTPRNFLRAKLITEYYTKVFDLDIEYDKYMFHIYNLAEMLSIYESMSDNLVEVMGRKDGFFDEVKEFEPYFYQLRDQING